MKVSPGKKHSLISDSESRLGNYKRKYINLLYFIQVSQNVLHSNCSQIRFTFSFAYSLNIFLAQLLYNSSSDSKL